MKTAADFNFRDLRGAGPIGEEIAKLQRAVRALLPVETPTVRPEMPGDGLRLHAKVGGGSKESLVERLWIRHIGIDAMWVSRPGQGGAYLNYHYLGMGGAHTDHELHYFCLKPNELQNALWWDEDASEGRFNDAYGISGGASPQTGLLTVQSVSGESYNLGYGAFTGITGRVLHDDGGTPEELVESVDPMWKSGGWGAGETNYGSATVVHAVRIPRGRLVCDEKGKVIWDHLSGFSKPTTLGSVVTWALDDPSGPGGLVSVPKQGNYDVEFVDLNVDARKWLRLTTP